MRKEKVTNGRDKSKRGQPRLLEDELPALKMTAHKEIKMSDLVPVYDNGVCVARVQYNNALDYWNGSNWTSGSTGRHLGITRLKKTKQFVLIYGTQWQGERDYGEIVSDEEALQAILKSNKDELLKKYFPDRIQDEEE